MRRFFAPVAALVVAVVLMFSAYVPVQSGMGNCGQVGKCKPTPTPTPVVTPSPTSSPTPSLDPAWTRIVDDEFNSGGVPTHWSLYDGPYGSAPNNCAVPSHATVGGGYLNLLMAYETSGKCGAAWYTAGMQITQSLGGVDQRVTLRWRVTGTDLTNVRSHRNIPMRWVSDPNYQWYQGESDYCEGSALTGCTTFLHYANPGQISHAYSVDVTQWHTWQFVHRANRVTTYIDGVLAWDYQGDAVTVPDAFRVAVLQQECQSSCPSSAYAGQSETIQVDWLTIDNPSTAPSPTPTIAPATYTFDDEFAGTTLDPLWIRHFSCCGTLAGYDPSLATVSGGYLHLSVVNRSTGWYGYLLDTKTTFTQKYGYFEARMQIPKGAGLWPAFWMYYSGNAEIDTMEVCANPLGANSGNDASLLHQTIHYTNSTGGNSSTGYPTRTADLSLAFHVYGVEWRSSYVKFYLDGVLTGTFTDTAHIPTSALPLIVNLGIGGSWCGTAGAPSPSTLLVDWIRARS